GRGDGQVCERALPVDPAGEVELLAGVSERAAYPGAPVLVVVQPHRREPTGLGGRQPPALLLGGGRRVPGSQTAGQARRGAERQGAGENDRQLAAASVLG